MKSEQAIRDRVRQLSELIRRSYGDAATRSVSSDRRDILLARASNAERERAVLQWVLEDEALADDLVSERGAEA